MSKETKDLLKKMQKMEKEMTFFKAKLVEAQTREREENFLKPHEIEIIKVCTEAGYSTRKIATLLGRAKSTVQSHIQKMRKDPSYAGVVSKEKNWKSKDGKIRKPLKAAKGSVTETVEKILGRKIKWKNRKDKNLYDRIWKKAKQFNHRPYTKYVPNDETDEERAERLCSLHKVGKCGNGSPLKNKMEHDREKQCPYCYPNKSRFSVKRDSGGLTNYDRWLRGRNMSSIDYVKSQISSRTEKVGGSGIFDEEGNDIGIKKEEDEVKLNPSAQRYVNGIERRIKAQQTEIDNIKKKAKGDKK